MDVLAYHPANPYRAVDWRWHRAGQIASGAMGLSRRRDDPWVHRAVKFRRRLEACATPWDLLALAEDEPGVYWAHDTWKRRPLDEGHVASHALEARLLAAQPHADIADSSTLDLRVVAAYEALFFDVAGKHDKIDYIAQTVMGPAFYRGVRARSYDLLWKLYGWGYGPMFVDMLLTQKVVRARPGDPAGLQAALGDVARSSVRLKGLVAAQTAEVNNHTAVFLIGELHRLAEIEKSAGAGGGQQTIAENIGAMMARMPFRVGLGDPPSSVADRRLDLGDAAALDRGAAELRGDELMRLGAGLPVPAAPHLRLMAYPTPPPAQAALPAPSGA